jgi:hypothetical protein
VTSKKGNVISKNASEEDPAIVISRDGVSPNGWLQQADKE